MQTERTRRPRQQPTGRDHCDDALGKTRTATVATARRQLIAATNAISDNRAGRDEIRKAHLMASRAIETLDLRIQQLADLDADGHRAHAVKTAKTMKDARGRRRAPATMPGYHKGRPNPAKGKKYKPTPPSINDTLKMLAAAPSLQYAKHGACPVCGAGRHRGERHHIDCRNPYGERLRSAILLLWRGGMRVGCELLRLTVDDLYPEHGYVYIANGKGGKSREVVIDPWVWTMLEPWIAFRAALPGDALFSVIEGPTAGRAWNVSNLRRQIHALAAHCDVKTRCAPHQWRHAHAVECVVEGVPELYVSRQLGHADLGITSTYLQGLPQSRVREALANRPMPQISMMEALSNEGARFKRATPDLMGTLARKELMAA